MSARRDGNRPLRPGDVVEVRAPAEILATLDSSAAIDAMPFMPEMLQHVGKRFTISSRVEKICDTVSGGPARSLRMRDTLFLDDLRCDGSAHGGCQAGCRLYWKESWLRRVDSLATPEPLNQIGRAELEQRALEASRTIRELDDGAETFRCQATEAVRASEPLSTYDVRQYLRELSSGNVRLMRVLRVLVRALWITIGRRLRLVSWQPLPRHSPPPHSTPATLGLQPGELVQIRSRDEIAETLDEHGKTRGLWFDWEMIPYCGGQYRVKDRVQRIIDERTGHMLELSSDCLILEGVACSGERSTCHWFCPRQIYPYWREAWLRRVDASEDAPEVVS